MRLWINDRPCVVILLQASLQVEKKKRSIKRQENSARTDFTVTGARAGILEPSPDNITLAIFKHSTILENSDNK